MNGALRELIRLRRSEHVRRTVSNGLRIKGEVRDEIVSEPGAWMPHGMLVARHGSRCPCAICRPQDDGG